MCLCTKNDQKNDRYRFPIVLDYVFCTPSAVALLYQDFCTSALLIYYTLPSMHREILAWPVNFDMAMNNTLSHISIQKDQFSLAVPLQST